MNFDVFTVQQLCDRYELSERMILEAIRRGELKASRLGVKTLITAKAFFEFVEANERKPKLPINWAIKAAKSQNTPE